MEIAKPEAKTGGKAPLRATATGSPRKNAPKFKQRNTRQFKSKPPKRGVIGYASFIFNFIGVINGVIFFFAEEESVFKVFLIFLLYQLWRRYPWNGGPWHW